MKGIKTVSTYNVVLTETQLKILERNFGFSSAVGGAKLIAPEYPKGLAYLAQDVFWKSTEKWTRIDEMAIPHAKNAVRWLLDNPDIFMLRNDVREYNSIETVVNCLLFKAVLERSWAPYGKP